MDNISVPKPPYTLRPAVEADFEFLRQLHSTTLRPYVEQIWGWNDDQQLTLLRERFDPSKIKIIQKNRIDIGVLQVEHRSDEVFLGNVLLQPGFQNKGLGTQIIGDVINDANKMQLPVTLTVLRPNPAKTLYERLGFRVTSEDSVRFFMKRESAPTQCLLSIQIRPERVEDKSHISELHLKAFGGKAEGTLVNLLRESNAFVPELSLVAVKNAEIVGHVLFSKIELTQQGVAMKCLSLAPIGVAPTLQKKGIGKRLIRAGLDKARALEFDSILVLGDPNYYSKFGFRNELTRKINSKYSCDSFMGLELTSNCLSRLTDATATYPEAFSAVD